MRKIFFAILLSACATETVQTRSEACQEQAELWCLQIGHPNVSCELGYRNACAPAGVDHERAYDEDHQTVCLNALVCKVDEAHNAVPTECSRLWVRK